MEVKKKITLQSVFWRFSICLFGLTAASLLACWIMIFFLPQTGEVLPANYSENMLEDNREKIENAKTVTDELIPDGCSYGVFQTDGTYLYGNMNEKNQNKVWNEYTRGGSGNPNMGYLKCFQRKEGVCIAAYRLKAEFVNPFLRKWLPDFPETVLILSLLAFLIGIVLLSRKFGNIVGRELKSVKQVTEKVRLKDLEFEKPDDTRIREVDEVMESLEKMREALEASLKAQWKMEEARRQQIGALIHDIKTPLTVIRGNAQLMQEAESAEEARECEEYILQETGRIEEYIQILQRMLQSEEGSQLQKEKVDVRQTAEAFAASAKMLAEANHQNLEVVISSIPDYIKSNRQLLLRAWENLLSNALEYTPAGGDICISIKEESGKLLFAIEDSGLGFTEEGIRRGTQQFYQGDKSRNSRNHYGVGLFMVDSFVKHQGGRLTLENSPRTKGALVRLEINM